MARVSYRTSRLLWQYGLLGVCLVVLAVFLLLPIALTVRGGFVETGDNGETGYTLKHFALVLADPLHREGLANAFMIAVWTTLLSIVVSLPLAVLSARYALPLKRFWNAVILVPLILPPFVGAIGMRAVLGREGMVNSLFGTDFDVLGQGRVIGVIIVEALHLYPIIYLNAVAALSNLDPALDEAAENLGAGPVRRFFRITLPLIRPGLFAGATIVFIWSFTELGTPLMFEYNRVTPVQIFLGLKEIEASAEPYALTALLLAAAVAIYIVGKVVFGRRGHAMYSKASRSASEKPLPLWGAAVGTVLFAGVTLAAVLPHIGVVLTGITAPGQWYGTVFPTMLTGDHVETALSDPVAAGSIRNSLILSIAAMLFNVVAGVVVAYLVVRTRIRGRNLLDALCMLPLAVPGLVMAFGYFAMTLSGPLPWIASKLEGAGLDGLSRYFQVVGTDPNPFVILAVAYAVRRLPYIVRSASAGLEQTSSELEEAAVNLGASRLKAIRKVVLPLVLANVIAGGLLVFSFSMLEVSDSLILAQQSKHYPITKAIYEFWNRLGDGAHVASAMGIWGMALLAVTLVGASVLMGKKLGSIFRA
ncbi:MAG: iron ABC transporter permease [Planctomycetota bacterium]